MILHRWVNPEFKDEDNMSTDEEVAIEIEDNRAMINNSSIREEERITVDVEMEELQPLKARK